MGVYSVSFRLTVSTPERRQMMDRCTRGIWVARASMEAAWVMVDREGVAVAITRLGSRAGNNTNIECLHSIGM
jgi:hypothetical protein